MTSLHGPLSVIALGTLALAIGASSARADAYVGRTIYTQKPGFWLACEDGRNYPIRAAAVSEDGDLVTGYLVTGHGQIHIRLIPMGDGYRYAGRGIWFDGLRADAVLNWGTPRAVNCTVTQG
jgi:hypothetical protein